MAIFNSYISSPEGIIGRSVHVQRFKTWCDETLSSPCLLRTPTGEANMTHLDFSQVILACPATRDPVSPAESGISTMINEMSKDDNVQYDTPLANPGRSINKHQSYSSMLMNKHRSLLMTINEHPTAPVIAIKKHEQPLMWV